MKPFPLGLDPPGARVTTSTTQNRSPVRLMAIIAEHAFRGHARYTPRDVDGKPGDETFCNVKAQDIAEAMGVLLPRYKRANETFDWLHSELAKAAGWEKLDGAHIAQAMADAGQFAVGITKNPLGPGHIVTFEPALGEPGAWCAQAGRTNSTRLTLAQAFGSLPVTFFGHP